MNPLKISPEEFKRISEGVLKIAVEYLQDIDARKIPPKERGTELLSAYHSPIPETGMGSEAIPGLGDIVRHSRAQNGRFFGYVLG